MTGSKLLINEPPLQVLPSLAKLVGLNQAIILQQMHYWSLISPNEQDGYRWVYNSYRQWSEQFPWLSPSAIQKHIAALEKVGLIISARFNKLKFDKTKWYRLNYSLLEERSGIAKGDDDYAKGDNGERQNGQPIPETTQETTTEITGVPPVPRLSNNPQIAEMQKFLGFPEPNYAGQLNSHGKDPIPNPAKEAGFIRKMLKRGYTWQQIFDCWALKVLNRHEFVSMNWVNEDIGRDNGKHQVHSREDQIANLKAAVGVPLR